MMLILKLKYVSFCRQFSIRHFFCGIFRGSFWGLNLKYHSALIFFILGHIFNNPGSKNSFLSFLYRFLGWTSDTGSSQLILMRICEEFLLFRGLNIHQSRSLMLKSSRQGTIYDVEVCLLLYLLLRSTKEKCFIFYSTNQGYLHAIGATHLLPFG